MSNPGHCRHCRRYCKGSSEEEVFCWTILAQEHRDTADVARWDDGHCPACDEAERIAGNIKAGGDVELYLLAEEIARGET